LKLIQNLGLIEAVENTEGTPLYFERLNQEREAIEFSGPDMSVTLYPKAKAIEFRVNESFEGFTKRRSASLSSLFENHNGRENTLASVSKKVAMLNVRILLCEEKRKNILDRLPGFKDEEE